MKIVFYDYNHLVLNIVEDVIDPVPGDGSITWNGGGVRGLTSNYIIVEDNFAVSEGETLELEKILEIKKQVKRKSFEKLRRVEVFGKFQGLFGTIYDVSPENFLLLIHEKMRLDEDPLREFVIFETLSDGVISYTRDNFLILYDQFLENKDYWDNHFISKSNSIENADTFEELDTIEWLDPITLYGIISITGRATLHAKESNSIGLTILSFPGRATLTVSGRVVPPAPGGSGGPISSTKPTYY